MLHPSPRFASSQVLDILLQLIDFQLDSVDLAAGKVAVNSGEVRFIWSPCPSSEGVRASFAEVFAAFVNFASTGANAGSQGTLQAPAQSGFVPRCCNAAGAYSFSFTAPPGSVSLFAYICVTVKAGSVPV